MAVSLKDISRVTNINTCSISQVLNNHPKAMSLRPETRAKILAAAKELGYCKNEMAASMSGKHSKILAFVTCPMGGSEYTGVIQNGILNTAAERGYTIIVFRLETMSEDEIIAKLLGWRVAGVVFHISKVSWANKIISVLKKNSIYYGFVNLSNPDGIGVTSDDRMGIEEAVKYLVERGHRKIAFARIGLKNPIEYDIRRVQGYRDGLAEYNPEQEEKIFNIKNMYLSDDKEYLDGVISEIIAEKFDAVICISDLLAAEINNAALQHNYRVPENFSLIGFGNSVISPMLFPPLTTISQDFELMGRTAVNFIIDRIENKNDNVSHNIMQPTKLLVRKSVK